jgi:hypothetical protein
MPPTEAPAASRALCAKYDGAYRTFAEKLVGWTKTPRPNGLLEALHAKQVSTGALATFPNSGTTFTQQLLAQLYGSTFTTYEKSECGGCPPYGHVLRRKSRKSKHEEWANYSRPVIAKTHLDCWMAAKPSRHNMDQHGGAGQTCADSFMHIFLFHKLTFAVRIVRNPLDNVVARFHFQKPWRTRENKTEMKKFRQQHSPLMLESFMNWHSSFDQMARQFNIPTFTFLYEDLVERPESTMLALMHWLGHTHLESADIANAVGTIPVKHGRKVSKTHCPVYWEWYTAEEVEMFTQALEQYS